MSRRKASRSSHANRGLEWERLLEGHHKILEQRGHAIVFRTPPPVQLLGRLGKPGQWRAVVTGDGPPDYVLLMNLDGQPVPVAMEAKDSANKRWSFDKLKEHQANHLQRWHELGGLSVVAFRHQPTKSMWLLPWWELGPQWNRWRMNNLMGRRAPSGTASLGAAGLDHLGIGWSLNDGYSGALATLWAQHPARRVAPQVEGV